MGRPREVAGTMMGDGTVGALGAVLCIDPDAYLLDMLAHALKREGFSVQSACTAAQALQLVERHRPDIVLMERSLPDRDGLALCSHLHRAHRLPVIFLTTLGEEADVLAGFSHGADAYLTKPFSVRVLTHRLRSVLRRVRITSAAGGATPTGADPAAPIESRPLVPRRLLG